MCQIIAPQDAIAERLFQATLQTLKLFGVYLGRTLGLYRALHRSGPLSARQARGRPDLPPPCGVRGGAGQ